MNFRQGVRALLLDDADNVLLVHFDWDGLEYEDGFWCVPGGGLDPGESHADGLARELREEVGIEGVIGPKLWVKTTEFPMSAYDGQIDHTYLVRAPGVMPPPAPEFDAATLAAENIRGIRWWSAADVIAGGAVFAPRALPELLASILAEGAPAEPFVIEGF